MATISGRYIGELRTEATHLASGNTLLTDAPKDNQGRGEAFSPSDSVCAALASCMLTIMGIVASRHQISLDGTRFEVTKIMTAEPPRRIAEIKVEFTVPNPDLNEKDRELLKPGEACPLCGSEHHPYVQHQYQNRVSQAEEKRQSDCHS